MSTLIEVLIVIGCLLLSAFFSGGETALLRLRSSDVEGDPDPDVGPSGPAIHVHGGIRRLHIDGE